MTSAAGGRSQGGDLLLRSAPPGIIRPPLKSSVPATLRAVAGGCR
ncbi:hypothetical protein O4J56_04085 [Nocardiopsis sp. RSe5-2]|uniref:Uncharacterized protein n=1 Tax=Nocardiopsis endophytica TaxID=3018445 RepID=A0ABT4U011_9ACTN|nr:hypothetical protein [Nocardiopsis endophytica]MDA2809810.1 hypothetical protein [Nocardiopsis endophytica]